MDFRAGQFYANRDLWRENLELVRSRGGFVPPIVSKAVEAGVIDPFDSEITDLKLGNNCRFRGKYFSNFQELINYDFPNSPSVLEFHADVLAEIYRIRDFGGVREISEEEALGPDSILNPIQWFRDQRSDGTVKTRLRASFLGCVNFYRFTGLIFLKS